MAAWTFHCPGLAVQAPCGCGPPVGGPARVSFAAPPQLVVPSRSDADDVARLLAAWALEPPLLVKALRTDACEDSHAVGVLHDELGLRLLLGAGARATCGGGGAALEPPLVLQRFVAHGDVMYKAYVVGGAVLCVARPTLTPAMLDRSQHVQLLNRVSAEAQPRESEQQRQQRQSMEDQAGSAPTRVAPPEWALLQLAAHLSRQLGGLTLFNVDIIQPETSQPSSTVQYLVVDVNYFPGYDKVSGAEPLLAAHLGSCS